MSEAEQMASPAQVQEWRALVRDLSELDFSALNDTQQYEILVKANELANLLGLPYEPDISKLFR